MAAKPTPGGSDGTYGTELNEFLDVSLADDGKVKDGAVLEAATEAGDGDRTIADKGWADAAPAAQMTPTSYANEESVTYPNGLIEKNGFKSAAASVVVSFAVAFPTALKTIQLTTISTIGDFDDYQVDNGTYSKTGFTAQVAGTTNLSGFFWTAKGY
jgi:hypothetical protein